MRTTCSATTVQVATPVAATTPRRTPLSSPALLPVPGGAPGPAYGAPLRGSPEPLGASYDKELVRGWGARFAPLAANGAAEQIASRRCNLATSAVGAAARVGRGAAALGGGAPCSCLLPRAQHCSGRA